MIKRAPQRQAGLGLPHGQKTPVGPARKLVWVTLQTQGAQPVRPRARGEHARSRVVVRETCGMPHKAPRGRGSDATSIHFPPIRAPPARPPLRPPCARPPSPPRGAGSARLGLRLRGEAGRWD